MYVGFVRGGGDYPPPCFGPNFWNTCMLYRRVTLYKDTMDLREGRGQCEWVHYQHYNSAGQSQGKNDNIGRRDGVTEKGSNDGREG